MSYTIAEISKRCNLTAHTLRYYDKEGLLPFVDRTPSGVRKFKDEDFEWLAIIVCLKNTGMPVKQIKIFIDWCIEGDITIPKRYKMFIEQKKRVEEQMAELNRCMEKIEYKISYYERALETGTMDVSCEEECLDR